MKLSYKDAKYKSDIMDFKDSGERWEGVENKRLHIGYHIYCSSDGCTKISEITMKELIHATKKPLVPSKLSKLKYDKTTTTTTTKPDLSDSSPVSIVRLDCWRYSGELHRCGPALREKAGNGASHWSLSEKHHGGGDEGLVELRERVSNSGLAEMGDQVRGPQRSDL